MITGSFGSYAAKTARDHEVVLARVQAEREPGLADPLRGGGPAADGAADPGVGVIKGRDDLDEVEYRVLHSCARREHRWVPGPQYRIRPMDEDAGNLHSRRTLRRGNGDRDEGT